MKNVMGVIYTGENDANLRELTLTVSYTHLTLPTT